MKAQNNSLVDQPERERLLTRIASTLTFVQNFILELEHRSSPIARVTISLNGIQHVFVEIRKVRKGSMTAPLAYSVFHSVME
jgi:hypothetical protein